jgi:hypothetical protein
MPFFDVAERLCLRQSLPSSLSGWGLAAIVASTMLNEVFFFFFFLFSIGE